MKKRQSYFRWTIDDFYELIPRNFGAFLRMFSSLSSRNFRLYFFGQCFSLCGTWIQYVAQSWLIYSLTGSVLLLTTVALVNQLPNLIITPFAGVISDRVNKYKVIVSAQILFMVQALVLASLTLSGVISDASDAWIIILLSGFNGLVAAVEAPSRQAFYSKLVPPKDMTNAIALNSVTINGARFVGPTIGGVLIALVGEGYCFLINGFSYIVVLVALVMIRFEYVRSRKERVPIFASMKEGVLYINRCLPIKAVLLFVAAISFFGLPFMSIVPALVKDTLHGDSTLLGYMNSSIGAGAMTAALYLASRKKVRGLGKVITITGLVMGASLVLMSFTKNPVVACVLAFPLGFAMIGSMATSNTLLQTIVEDNKRGRVMSFFTMAFAGMSPLGGMLYAPFVELTSLSWVLFGVGVICIGTSFVYEYYRPIVRKAACEGCEDNGMISEIAGSISDNHQNPF